MSPRSASWATSRPTRRACCAAACWRLPGIRKRKEIVVGSADGAPKLFKMEVTAAPASGGNPNQIREYEALPGRVFDVRFSPDGTRFFAASSLNGQGQVRCYETDSGTVAWKFEVEQAAVYALACSPDGATLAAAGADGQIRLLDAANGTLTKMFLPVDVIPQASRRGNVAGRRRSGAAVRRGARGSRPRLLPPSSTWSRRRSGSPSRPTTSSSC